MCINYHPGKANVVANALSRKSYCNVMTLQHRRPELHEEFAKLNLGNVSSIEVVVMEIDSTLDQEICKGQLEDERIIEIKQLIKKDKAPGFTEDGQRVVLFKKRLCVPDIKSIRELILREAHYSTYSIHPGSTKMYQDLKTRYSLLVVWHET